MMRKIMTTVTMVMFISMMGCGNSKSNGNTVDKTNALEKETIKNTQIESNIESTKEDEILTETYTKEEETSEKATEEFVKETEKNDEQLGTSFSTNIEGVTNLEELEKRIDEHLTLCIESLYSRWKSLEADIDTFGKYVSNVEKVSTFYETIIEETEGMCIMLYDYSAIYARMVLDSDMSYKDKYKEIKGINDCIYKDACDEIHDEIYEGILDEMKDHFYDGILEDGKDTMDYSDWYDIYADEYDQWYDTYSEVYEIYYDTLSDIYSFYIDMSGDIYGNDVERAEKTYNRFLQKITK